MVEPYLIIFFSINSYKYNNFNPGFCNDNTILSSVTLSLCFRQCTRCKKYLLILNIKKIAQKLYSLLSYLPSFAENNVFKVFLHDSTLERLISRAFGLVARQMEKDRGATKLTRSERHFHVTLSWKKVSSNRPITATKIKS